ncbi:MAG: restriction endonuclease [Firmicutes bacterium]|nr:restriction endonuclease [Bacillota bacterium]
MASYYYSIEIRHEGLHKYRVIKGNDKYIVEQKARAQLAVWDEMWKRRLAVEAKQKARIAAVQEKEAMKNLAAEQTKELQKALKDLDETLLYTLSINDKIDWESLKTHEKFKEPKPKKPILKEPSVEPMEDEFKYRPRIGFLGFFFKKIKEQRIAEAKNLFERDHVEWVASVQQIEEENRVALEQYEKEVKEWEARKEQFYRDQEAQNAAVDERKKVYESKDPGAIVDYCDMVLSNSKYPDYFPQEYELDFNPQNGILVVDYSLPAPNVIPKVKEIKYVQSKNSFSEVYVSESEANKRYDSLLYQICLRTIHELFEADAIEALNTIVFNGWVRSIDPSNGREVNNCVISVMTNKKDFTEIELAKVDPKACFKALKGVGSSKLISLTPIPPVLKINKTDSRFVSSYEVAKSLDESVNLAAMDWEDFEHLIRELFEKEFSMNGGEVKVTQASRDGGVDAIAFDPDPIRGGKIVIQAKRYTNTVGVSAVRDLFGTVMNEGATKGLLVTTSDYGPDAYEFAKGKPLTLLNGANLLSLLEKHGHKAKIDLKEAKLLSKNANRIIDKN